MIEDLTDRQVGEIIQARYNSESPHKLTKKQKKISEERIKKANEYAAKLIEEQIAKR